MWFASLQCSALTVALITTASIFGGCSPSSRVTPPITNQPSDTVPAWSPDRHWIAYSHFGLDVSDTSGLYVADTTGAQRRLLALGHPRSIDWSPDSRNLIYDDEAGIHVISLDGTSTRTIYAGGSFPSWSPDGSTIAFDTARHIWLMSPTGADLQQASDAFPVRMPDWSEDGQRLVVVEYPQSTPGGELAVIQLSDGTSHLVTSNTNVDEYPRWSPTSGMIVWSHWAQSVSGANQPEVWLADTSGAGAHRLIVADAQPDWHPGGHAVVFSMQASGGIRLFIVNTDGTGLRQVTH
jgi:Tol biopolymer transport system component